jgi:hypothetical protein
MLADHRPPSPARLLGCTGSRSRSKSDGFGRWFDVYLAEGFADLPHSGLNGCGAADSPQRSHGVPGGVFVVGVQVGGDLGEGGGLLRVRALALAAIVG